MGNSGFDLVIFDCDGVLIDSEVLSCRIEAEELTRLGYAITAEEIIQRFVGLSSATMWTAIEQDWGRRLPADFPAAMHQRVLDSFRSDLRAVPGVAELLARLAMPACVASSSEPDRLRMSLGVVGFYDRFAPNVFSATMVARGKPAPDLFLFAAERMGAAPARCLVVEDSPAGVTAAKAAGMTAIGFCGGGHCAPGHDARLAACGADRVIAGMVELEALLGDGLRPASRSETSMKA